MLFGSRARGEGDEHSDLDVLVVLKEPSRKLRRSILDIATDVLIAVGVDISPLVRDDTGVIDAGLWENISRDGVALYPRPA